MFNRKFPYTDMHDLNLDWVMRKVKEMAASVQNISSSISSVTAAYLQEHLPDMLGDSLDDFCNSVNASLTDLQSAVTALGSAYPTVVTLASDMADTSVIYLYAGSESGYVSGDWYYYNGSAWVSGGTYGTGTISANARNLLSYILNRVAYTETGMSTYITALINALTPVVATSYSITYTLTNVTSSVDTASVTEGDSFTCTLTAASGYDINSVTVTMGGVDVTSSVYTNGTVTIGSVTGNVVITATATYLLFGWKISDGEDALLTTFVKGTNSSGTQTFEWDSTLGYYVSNTSTTNYAGLATSSTYDMSTYEFLFTVNVQDFSAQTGNYYGMRISQTPSIIISDKHVIYDTTNSVAGTYTASENVDFTVRVTNGAIYIDDVNVIAYSPSSAQKVVIQINGAYYLKSVKIREVA